MKKPNNLEDYQELMSGETQFPFDPEKEQSHLKTDFIVKPEEQLVTEGDEAE